MSDVFGLTAADYWDDPFRTISDFAWDRVRDGVPGIHIGAPEAVDVDEHAALPMVAYRCDTLAELIRTPFHHAVVVASRLDAPDVIAGEAEIDEDGGRTPASEPQPGFGGGSRLIRLDEILPLRWTPARWLVRVLLRDRQSNAITIELTRRGVARIPSLPSLELTVEAPRVVIREPDAAATARVAFRLPLAHGAVKVPEAIPVWLVMIGSRSGGFAVERIGVPPQALEATTEGPVVSGATEVDLFRNRIVAAGGEQTFFVYAFCAAATAGPALMGVVDPEGAE